MYSRKHLTCAGVKNLILSATSSPCVRTLSQGFRFYDFPVHSSFENGGEDIRSFCDGSLAVASRLSIPPDTAFCHGNIEAVYIVGLDFRQDHMPKHGKNLIVDFGVVLFQCTRLQILRGVFLSPSVNKLTKGSFFSCKNQTVFTRFSNSMANAWTTFSFFFGESSLGGVKVVVSLLRRPFRSKPEYTVIWYVPLRSLIVAIVLAPPFLLVCAITIPRKMGLYHVVKNRTFLL